MRNSLVQRVLKGIWSQIKHKVKSFVAFAVAMDESMHMTDVAQLAKLIRGVDETLQQ